LLGPEVRVVLEIGANIGQDTTRLLAAFPNAIVHCFEPDPRALARLRADVVSNRVRVHPLAISAVDGPVTFYASSGAPPGQEHMFPDGWHLSGSVRSPKAHLEVHPWCRFDTTIEVESRRLDTWAAEHDIDAVDFIWADVQGAESDVVRGGLRTLARTRVLYTEFSNRELYEGQVDLAGLRALLPGWKLERRYRGDVLLVNRAGPAGPEGL
jgi:FkbM family methyltransferase